MLHLGFDIDLNILGLSKAVKNLKWNNYNLVADYDETCDRVHAHELIEVDVIQFNKELKLIDCMHGSTFQVATCRIPFCKTNYFCILIKSVKLE